MASSHLREGAIVPEIALVREAVPDVAQLALLDVLLDGVEGLLLGDLLGASATNSRQLFVCSFSLVELGGTHLHLGVGPAGHLNDHVEDRLLLVGIQRDVVEGRDGHAILLDEDAVFEGVGGANLPGSVDGCHCCRVSSL